jgi:thiol-disulfide isomerase/thioredoxin
VSSPGIATVHTRGSTFDTILAVYKGTSLLDLTEVGSNDDANDVTDTTSKVRFVVSPLVTYYIAVDGFFGEVGDISLSLSFERVAPPANDHYANAAAVAGANVSVSGSNLMATMEANELTPTADGGASVWWTWEAPTSERYAITTAGSDFDTVLSVYAGETLMAWNDDADEVTSFVRFKATAGTRYHISVQGYDGDMGAIRLGIEPSPPVRAPAWTLVDMSGKTIRLSDFAGKVVMLDFWATWCGPCVSEVPDFIAMQEEYGPDGFVIVSVSTDENGWNAVAPFVDQHGVNYISTLTTASIERDYGPIRSIPTTFIIDRQGMIQETFVGSRSRAVFDSVLLPLIYPAIDVALGASREGNNLLLTWPAAATGYTLQSSSDVSASTGWTAVGAQISVVGELNVARIPMSEVKRWFRLIHN